MTKPGKAILQRLASEPWSVVMLCFTFPGLGSIITGRKAWGAVAMVATCGFIGFSIYQITSYTGDATIGLGALLLGILFYSASIISAFFAAKYRLVQTSSKDLSKRKDVFFVIFLSILLPGAGHCYLREYRQGCVHLALVAGVLLLGFHRVPYILLIVYSWIACVSALRLGTSHDISFSRKYLVRYVTAFYVVNGFKAFLFAFIWNTVLTISLPSGFSMYPTLQSGDVVLTDLMFAHGLPRGGIVIFMDEALPTQIDKRLTAFPGETVQISGGSLYINEKKITEKPFSSLNYHVDQSCLYGCDRPFLVPNKSVFALGDNSEFSADSRQIGPLPSRAIKGVLYKIIWPLSRSKTIFPIIDDLP